MKTRAFIGGLALVLAGCGGSGGHGATTTTASTVPRTTTTSSTTTTAPTTTTTPPDSVLRQQMGAEVRRACDVANQSNANPVIEYSKAWSHLGSRQSMQALAQTCHDSYLATQAATSTTPPTTA